jgi:hypothetical protein
MNSETTKTKKIADLPMDERRRLLEAAAVGAVDAFEFGSEVRNGYRGFQMPEDLRRN